MSEYEERPYEQGSSIVFHSLAYRNICHVTKEHFSVVKCEMGLLGDGHCESFRDTLLN